MARPTRRLVEALRTTAARLAAGSEYRWTHMGACNCGHLAQTLTGRSGAEIHRIAVQKAGDWGQHAVDHCPASGYPIDHVLDRMLEVGLEPSDVEHLERLSDPAVLRRFALGDRALSHRDRGDVVRYMERWADLLEAKLEPSGIRQLPGREAGSRRAG